MAGVYIKGMEMPRDGIYRMGLVVKDGKITAGVVKEESFADKDIEWFDCVLVPDHGDLIDREELIKIMLNTPIKAVDGVDFDQAWFTRVADTACQFVDEVEQQVAVIPEDKEEV